MNHENIYEKLNTSAGVASLLALDDFSPVYQEADRVRRKTVGDVVHLRAIIEFSNVCRRQCRYCGLNRRNKALPRYRMSREEIVQTAAEAVAAGYRTIVLQSGEDEYFTAERLGEIISDVKALGVAVTVSCGERPPEDYRYWREKGADRYLLKHETADPELYDRLHPCGTLAQRINCLKTLQSLGYETGGGFMIGLPGQSLETIGRDLLLLKEIPCRMAGIGPFISNPRTELAGARNGEPELARRAVAIARLLLPEANLPLTTALSILSEKEKRQAPGGSAPLQDDNASQQESACRPENPFAFGANVIMKKVTPDAYKAAYEIYPAEFRKTNVREDRRALEETIRAFGRTPL